MSNIIYPLYLITYHVYIEIVKIKYIVYSK